MNRTDRLYAIAEALRAAGPAGLTSTSLADRFEVTGRTVKRDVTALQEAGVPITGIGGPGGGYVLDPRATLPPVSFTVGEAIAVAVALSVQGDQPFAADGRRALTKLLGVVPDTARPEADSLAGRVWVRGPGDPLDADLERSDRGPADDPLGGRMDRSVVRVVEEAVRTRTVVVIDYVDRSGARSAHRPVEAQGLAHDGANWQLLAWCQRRDAPRWFRLDRITAAVATQTPVVDRDVATAFGVPPPDAGPITLA